MNAAKLTLVTFIGLTLVCLIVGGIGGVILFGKVAHSNFRVQLSNSEEYGERFANTLETQLAHGVTEEQILHILQESFEASPPDASRYLCVMSKSGQLLCHPNTSILGFDAAGMTMLDFPSRAPITYRDWVDMGHVEGIFEDPSGMPKELIRRIPVGNAPWDVLVHTRLDSIAAETQVINRTIAMVMVPMGIFFVLFGTLVVRFVGRGYETAIETNNRELERRVAERTAELGTTVDQLQEARDALMLNEKLALMGQLVAGIAHEINNPLSAIRVTADVLAEDASEPDQREAALQISRSVHRCSLLVSNLLTFARRDAPRVANSPLNEVVEVSLSFCIADLRKEGVRVETCLAPEGPVLPLDRVQLEQVVLNLLNNALQAFEPERGDKRVRLETAAMGEIVRIVVEDSGPGIDSKMVPKLFEPFHTTKSTGTGLGLSLCKRFVESHGGTIRHRRSELGGARFEIDIPMRQAAADIPGSEEPAFIG